MKTQRTCGECTACCFTVGVEEMNKDWNEHCKFQCEGGCGVHGTDLQPVACKSWRCAWLAGMGAEDHRPDKSGIIVCPDGCAIFEGQRMSTRVREHRRGAMKEPQARAILEWASTIKNWGGVPSTYTQGYDYDDVAVPGTLTINDPDAKEAMRLVSARKHKHLPQLLNRLPPGKAAALTVYLIKHIYKGRPEALSESCRRFKEDTGMDMPEDLLRKFIGD